MDVNTYEYWRDERYKKHLKERAEIGERLLNAIDEARRSKEIFRDDLHPERLNKMSDLADVFQQMVEDVIASQLKDM